MCIVESPDSPPSPPPPATLSPQEEPSLPAQKRDYIVVLDDTQLCDEVIALLPALTVIDAASLGNGALGLKLGNLDDTMTLLTAAALSAGRAAAQTISAPTPPPSAKPDQQTSQPMPHGHHG